MFRDSPSRRPPDSLALGMTFNTNTLADCSGYAHTGSLVGNAAVSGKVLVLDGTGDYVTVPDAASLDMPSAFSVSLWFEPSTPGSVYRTPIAKYNTTGSQRSWYISAGYGVNSWAVIVSATGGALSGSTGIQYAFNQTIPTSGWHHMGLVIDTNASAGNRARLWVDGVELAETVTYDHSAFTPYNTSEPVQVGALTGTLAWKGNLDDVFLFRRALAENEVKQLYYRGREAA